MPRVTSALELRSETSLTIEWRLTWNILETPKQARYLYHSEDGGTTWSQAYVVSGNKGTYEILNLTPDTDYQIKTRVEFNDGSLETSAAITASTYPYPYPLTPPDFMVGEDVTVELFNPLGRPVLVELVASGTVVSAQTVTGQTAGGYDSSSVVNGLYATIPNSRQGSYKIRCTYAGHSAESQAASYQVNVYACSPTFQFNSLSYADTNPVSVSITGDDQQIIRNLSVVRFSAIASGLVARKSASLVACGVRIGNAYYDMTLSGGIYSGYDDVINSAYNVTAEIIITDSRGLTNSLDVPVTVLDWTAPTALISLARQSNYYSETDLKADAKYSYVGGHNSLSIAYKARKNGTQAWTVSGSLTNNVVSTVTLDNEFAWDVIVTLTDALGAETEYKLTVSRGLPLIYFDRFKNSVGVNCFPTEQNSLEVAGINVMRSIITLYLTPGLTVSTGDAYVRIPLFKLNSSGEKLSYNNYGVLIGDNVRKILVSAQAVIRAGSIYGERELVIGTGSGASGTYLTPLASVIQTLNNMTNNAQSIIISRALVNAAPGDQIYLYIKTPAGNTSEEILGGTKNPTLLTVETIE